MKYLFIFPHPDDETFFTGGLLQRLTKSDNVSLIILSKGEASTLRNGLSTKDDLSTVREQELVEVCKLLGVTDFKIESFPDSNFENSKQQIKDYIDNFIQQHQPDYVVTFEPYGAYGHPDHIVTSEVVVDLVPPEKLIYTTIDPSFKFSESTRNMSKIKNLKPIAPKYIYKLKTSEFFTKLKAMQLYKSQANTKNSLLHTLNTIWVMRKEYFTPASQEAYLQQDFPFFQKV